MSASARLARSFSSFAQAKPPLCPDLAAAAIPHQDPDRRPRGLLHRLAPFGLNAQVGPGEVDGLELVTRFEKVGEVGELSETRALGERAPSLDEPRRELAPELVDLRGAPLGIASEALRQLNK